MTKFKLQTIFILLIIALFLLPQIASAFNIKNALTGPLVPCGRDFNKNGQLDPGEECTLCHFFVLAKNIVDLILALIIILVPVFIVAGGIIMLTSAGKPDQVSLGRKIITSALIGLAIALISWTILSTLFNTLVNPGVMPWAWNKPDCPIN